MKKNIAVSAFATLATTAAFVSFTACGDDVTQITENYETGAETVKKKADLPHCNSTKTGALVFVSDSAQVFVCDGANWASLQGADGKDGVDGADGKQGERGLQGDKGSSGEGCTAESITRDAQKGFVITCGDVVDTLWDGRDGVNGKDGAPGSSGSKGEKGDKGDPGSSGAKGETGDPGSSGSVGPQGAPGSSGAQGIPGSSGAGCVATKVSDGSRSGLSIVCGNEEDAITLWDGADGVNGAPGSSGSVGPQGPQGAVGSSGAQGANGVGCSIESDVGGVITIVCGEGANATRTEIYKAVCGSIPYDPAEGSCANGILTTMFTDTKGSYASGVSNVYKTVQIGDQIWMDNMRATVSNPSGNDGHCGGYDNDCNNRGGLYTLNTAKSMCPDGWRLPTVSDWQDLFCEVDASACSKKLNGNFTGSNVEYNGQVVTDLKATRVWQNGNTGNDKYGFDFIPSGYFNGSVQETGVGFYWAEQGSDAVIVKLETSKITISFFVSDYASSVRCVKDAE